MAPDSMIVVLGTSAGGGSALLPFWTALVGAGVGLAASAVAAFTAFKIAKRQLTAQADLAGKQLALQATASENALKATVLAGNRVRWIETLRTEIAGFTATAAAVVSDLELDEQSADYGFKIDKLMHHAHIVALLTNHEEADSIELGLEIDGVMLAIRNLGASKDVKPNTTAFGEQLGRIMTIARRIQKAEWERVKRLE